MILGGLRRRPAPVVVLAPRPLVMVAPVDWRTPEERAADQARLDVALGLCVGGMPTADVEARFGDAS